jgi:hypothetical protein
MHSTSANVLSDITSRPKRQRRRSATSAAVLVPALIASSSKNSRPYGTRSKATALVASSANAAAIR